MINEDKIRKACSSDRERGFRLLVDSFQGPIYNYIRRMVVSHEDSEDAIVAKEKEAAELKRNYFGPEGELAKMRDKLITPIQDDIYEAVKAISQQHGYDMVIDRASATGIIFANPRIDISDEILRKLGYSN